MTDRRRRGSWTPLMALVISGALGVACLSGNVLGDPDTGPAPCTTDAGACEAAPDPAPCELAMPLSGGLVGTARASAGNCGEVAGSPFALADMAAVSFHLDQRLCPGETGAIRLYALSIVAGDPKNPRVWTTPVGACAITVDTNRCQTDTLGKRLVLAGHGSCSQPARPESAGDAPVYIGAFSFTFGQRI